MITTKKLPNVMPRISHVVIIENSIWAQKYSELAQYHPHERANKNLFILLEMIFSISCFSTGDEQVW